MRSFLVILFGAISGAILTAFFGPRIVAYWFSSPVHNACDCTTSIEWAMSRLVGMQLGFTIGGAVIFFVIDRLVFRRRKVIVTTG